MKIKTIKKTYKHVRGRHSDIFCVGVSVQPSLLGLYDPYEGLLKICPSEITFCEICVQNMTAPVARMKHKNVIRSRSITYLLTYKPRTGTPAAKLQRLHCQTSLTITGGYPGEILYKAAQENC